MSLSIRTSMSCAAVVLAAAALTGCAGPFGSGAGTPAPEPAPRAFVERAVLPSCGSVELGQGETIPQDLLDCFAKAGADGAELVVTAPTTEGDPIVTYYRALPGGGVERFDDMTADAYGGGWAHSTCPDAAAIDPTGMCTDAVAD